MEIQVSATNVTVTLDRAYSTIQVFDPMQSSVPIQSVSNASSVTLSLTDHPLIVEARDN